MGRHIGRGIVPIPHLDDGQPRRRVGAGDRDGDGAGRALDHCAELILEMHRDRGRYTCGAVRNLGRASGESRWSGAHSDLARRDRREVDRRKQEGSVPRPAANRKILEAHPTLGVAPGRGAAAERATAGRDLNGHAHVGPEQRGADGILELDHRLPRKGQPGRRTGGRLSDHHQLGTGRRGPSGLERDRRAFQLSRGRRPVDSGSLRQRQLGCCTAVGAGNHGGRAHGSIGGLPGHLDAGDAVAEAIRGLHREGVFQRRLDFRDLAIAVGHDQLSGHLWLRGVAERGGE